MDDIFRRLELQGEYDLADKQALSTLFGALRADGPATIDLTKVTYVDSTFLQALAELKSRFKEQAVTLLVGDKNVRRVLRLMQFDRLFEVVDAPGL